MNIRADGVYDGVPGWKYGVLLNGEKVPYCVEADDVQGYVLVQDREPGGRFLDSQTRIEGHVTIAPPPEPA